MSSREDPRTRNMSDSSYAIHRATALNRVVNAKKTMMDDPASTGSLYTALQTIAPDAKVVDASASLAQRRLCECTNFVNRQARIEHIQSEFARNAAAYSHWAHETALPLLDSRDFPRSIWGDEKKEDAFRAVATHYGGADLERRGNEICSQSEGALTVMRDAARRLQEYRDPAREETESHGDDDYGVGETNRFTAHTLADVEALHVRVVQAAAAAVDAFEKVSKQGEQSDVSNARLTEAVARVKRVGQATLNAVAAATLAPTSMTPKTIITTPEIVEPEKIRHAAKKMMVGGEVNSFSAAAAAAAAAASAAAAEEMTKRNTNGTTGTPPTPDGGSIIAGGSDGDDIESVILRVKAAWNRRATELDAAWRDLCRLAEAASKKMSEQQHLEGGVEHGVASLPPSAASPALVGVKLSDAMHNPKWGISAIRLACEGFIERLEREASLKRAYALRARELRSWMKTVVDDYGNGKKKMEKGTTAEEGESQLSTDAAAAAAADSARGGNYKDDIEGRAAREREEEEDNNNNYYCFPNDLVLCEDLLSDVRRFRREEEPERAQSLQEAFYLHDVIQQTLRLEGRVGWSLAPSDFAVPALVGDVSDPTHASAAPALTAHHASPPPTGLVGNNSTTTITTGRLSALYPPATVVKSAAAAPTPSDDPTVLQAEWNTTMEIVDSYAAALLKELRRQRGVAGTVRQFTADAVALLEWLRDKRDFLNSHFTNAPNTKSAARTAKMLMVGMKKICTREGVSAQMIFPLLESSINPCQMWCSDREILFAYFLMP